MFSCVQWILPWISTYGLKSRRESTKYSLAFGASTVSHHCGTTRVATISHLTHQHCGATRDIFPLQLVQVERYNIEGVNTLSDLTHQQCGATRDISPLLLVRLEILVFQLLLELLQYISLMTLFPILYTYSMVYSLFFIYNANYVLRKQ